MELKSQIVSLRDSSSQMPAKAASSSLKSGESRISCFWKTIPLYERSNRRDAATKSCQAEPCCPNRSTKREGSIRLSSKNRMTSRRYNGVPRGFDQRIVVEIVVAAPESTGQRQAILVDLGEKCVVGIKSDCAHLRRQPRRAGAVPRNAPLGWRLHHFGGIIRRQKQLAARRPRQLS